MSIFTKNDIGIDNEHFPIEFKKSKYWEAIPSPLIEFRATHNTKYKLFKINPKAARYIFAFRYGQDNKKEFIVIQTDILQKEFKTTNRLNLTAERARAIGSVYHL